MRRNSFCVQIFRSFSSSLVLTEGESVLMGVLYMKCMLILYYLNYCQVFLCSVDRIALLCLFEHNFVKFSQYVDVFLQDILWGLFCIFLFHEY